MNADTLIAALEFTHARLLGTLDAIEKSGQDPAKVLAWRPGPGRAHIAWQALHCAATHDKYLNVQIKAGSAVDADLFKNFAGGSTPADQNIPPLSVIREKIATHYNNFKSHIASLDAAGLERRIPGPAGKDRSVAEAVILLTWHEAHHQGQIHLTWNLYKAAHGLT